MKSIFILLIGFIVVNATQKYPFSIFPYAADVYHNNEFNGVATVTFLLIEGKGKIFYTEFSEGSNKNHPIDVFTACLDIDNVKTFSDSSLSISGTSPLGFPVLGRIKNELNLLKFEIITQGHSTGKLVEMSDKGHNFWKKNISNINLGK